MIFCKHVLQVAINDKQTSGYGDQEKCESKILDEQVDEFARADALLLYQKIVLPSALLAINALTYNDLGSLTVDVNFFARALARLTEASRDLDILEI